MPKRIQRKRTKGWRMPPRTLYMGRTGRYSIWENAYRVTAKGTREWAVKQHMEYLKKWKARDPQGFEKLLRLLNTYDNLACWCPIDVPCHVDNWLYFLNEEG